MKFIIEKINEANREKSLRKAATQLRNSEYKNETVEFVFNRIVSGEYGSV